MSDLLRPILELAVVIPGALLCLLPAHRSLRFSRAKTAFIFLPLLLCFCLVEGALSYFLLWGTDRLLYPTLVLLGWLYVRLVNLPSWKSISILLGVIGVFSCLSTLAIAFDSLFRESNTLPWITVEGGLIYNLMCWLLVGLVAYPAIRRLPWLLNANRLAPIRYIFWVLPSIFTVLNLFLVPIDYENVRIGRMFQGYILVETIFLGMLLLFYFLFFRMARELDNNIRLQTENQFLQMQTAQYEALRSAIAETRQARHDLRHHLDTLSALATRGDWPALANYLSQVRSTVPTTELNLCDNPAADGVACHYAGLCRREGIPFTCHLDLPRALPVAEMDLCVILSNLLENALEASNRTEGTAGYVRIEATLHGKHLVLLTVENAYSGKIHEVNGVFRSSKRKGDGVGLQSVRKIAEKNGGYCKFTYENSVFRANVMLRGAHNNDEEEI